MADRCSGGTVTAMPGWECTGVAKLYGRTVALDGVDVTFRSGEVTALLGHNGAGKTTLFRLAAGLAVADAGRMRLEGQMPGSAAARQVVSYVPEQPDLYPGVSVWEHVTFIALAHRLTGWRSTATELIERFGLADRRDSLPDELSQGLRRRLALVMALLHGARVHLLDEPFNGLDPAGSAGLRSILRELAGGGACVVVATHLLGDVDRLADRIVVLDHGRVAATGRTADLARRAGLPAGAGLEDAYLRLTGSVS